MTTPHTTPELPEDLIAAAITAARSGNPAHIVGRERDLFSDLWFACNQDMYVFGKRLLDSLAATQTAKAAPEGVSNHVPDTGKMMPEPEAWRIRYRSEPGMIGHYPWSYTGRKPRCQTDENNEIEALYTEAQMRSVLAAPPSPQPLAPPPGYAVVPLEPTPEMQEAGMTAHYAAENRINEKDAYKPGGFANRKVRASHVFAAMVAAAPQPPASVQPLAEHVAEVTAEGDTIRLNRRLPMGSKLYLAPPGGMVPLTPEQSQKIFQQVQTEVANLEAEHRYTFAGWFPVAVRLIEAAHGIKEGSNGNV